MHYVTYKKHNQSKSEYKAGQRVIRRHFSNKYLYILQPCETVELRKETPFDLKLNGMQAAKKGHRVLIKCISPTVQKEVGNKNNSH